jgi:basic membrane protein A
MRLAYSSALAAALLAATLFCANLPADPSLRLVSGDPEGGDALAAGSWKATLGFYGDSPASQSKRGSAYDILVAKDQGAYEGALRQASEARPDLVVAAGARFARAVDAAAAQYPDQNYLLIGGRSDKPNVMCASLGEAEAAYLSGLAAGLKAKDSKIPAPRFGFMGSETGPEATALELGFAAGVLAALPQAKIVDFYAGAEASAAGMPELGKVQARNWYDSGVFCVFDAAGRTGEGAVSAARQYRTDGKEAWIAGEAPREAGVYDPSRSASAVIATISAEPAKAILYALGALRDGTFKGGPVAFGLASGGASFSIDASDFSKGIASRLEASGRDLASGKVKLYSRYSDALAAKAIPEGLQAQDD